MLTMTSSVGQAAAQLGVAPSTLRYWEDEGLLRPARIAGYRRYGPEDLRRAALLSLARHLDLPLARAVEVLDGSPHQRREQATHEITRLRQLIERAGAAIELLENARDCPVDHPARDCPDMTAALDRILQGRDPRPAPQE